MKNLLSVIVLLLACAVLVSGMSLSYFSDKADINTTHFTTGNVKVDVKVDDKKDDWGNWTPDNNKTVTWLFTNTGSLDANLQVEITTNWDTSSVQQTVLNTVYKDYNTALSEPTVSWRLMSEGWVLEEDVYRYKTSVKPYEKIPLEFNLSIDDITGYEGADYNITLSVTATQVIDE